MDRRSFVRTLARTAGLSGGAAPRLAGAPVDESQAWINVLVQAV